MAHSKINKMGLGKIMFPNGCSYCGGDVLFRRFSDIFEESDQEECVYVCSNPDCMAYVPAHKETKGGAVRDYPIGILANKELRDLHELLRSKFAPLWMDNRIKFIYRDFIVSFVGDDGEDGVGIADGYDPDNKTYRILNEDRTITQIIPANRVSRVNTRTKAYYWLAVQMGMTYQSCRIPMLDLADTARAIQIVDDATKQFNFTNDAIIN